MSPVARVLLIPALAVASRGAAGVALKTVTPLAPKVPAVVETPLAGDLLGATVHRLANGLTVYLSPNPTVPRVTAWIAVRAGSKHDPAEATGMAHYLEHMLFKGTERMGTLDWEKEKPHLDRITELYSRHEKATDPKERERLYGEIDKENIEATKWEVPNEMDKLYRRMGFDDVNAFTMDEGTVFVCSFPKNRAEAWATVEAERFARPVFRLFQTELETVYEEKNRSMDHADTPLGEAVAKRMFPSHPYGIPTLGTIEHLKNPSLARMYEFYRTHYHPNNMAVMLAGDFDRAAMLALLDRTLGAWTPAPPPEAKTWPTPPPQGEARVEVKYESEEKVLVVWMTVPQAHADADPLRVMDMVMDNAVAGIINLSLVQAQKVKEAGSYGEELNDAGTWTVWAVPKQGQTVDQAETLLVDAVERLKRGEFTDADLKAVITNFEVGEKRKLESNEARVSEMMGSFLAEEEWAKTAGRMDRFRKVTKADVVRVANAYLGGNRVVAVRRKGKPVLPSIAKPKFTKIDIDDTRQSAFFAKVLALPATPIKPKWLVEGKDYAAARPAWGRLFTGPNLQNDVFTLSIGFLYGTGHEKRLGAALDLLDLSGAGDITAEQFKKKLYGLGTWLTMSADERWVYLGMSGLEAHLEESLGLLALLFTKPNTAPDTLSKMIDVQIGAHRDNKLNPRTVFRALAAWSERGAESPVLHELSDAELKALSVPDLHRLARGIWDHPRDVRYVGTRSAAEVGALMAATPQPTKPTPPQKEIAYLEPAKPRVVFTHRDMVQAQVYLYAADGVYDPARTVDDQFYSDYMGGGMSAVIFQEVREARALAYAAWGGYVEGHWKGDQNRVMGQLGCQADKTVEATTLLRELMSNPPLSTTRFAETAKSIEESYRTNPTHFRDAPETVLRWEEMGITGGDPRPKWFAAARAYTLDDLAKFSARFKDRPFTLAILGHRDRVGLPKLKTLGAFEEKPLDQLFPY